MNIPKSVSFENPTSRYTVMGEYYQKVARNKLKERMDNGEDPFEILGISRSYKYFVEKIVSGFIKFDDVLYYRITGENPYEDIYKKLEEKESELCETSIKLADMQIR